MKKIDILVISLTAPLKIGIYENGNLIEEFESFEKTSEVLPLFFENILKTKKYEINELYYNKGPGSFMAIKITYIFLKSFSILNGFKLKATLGFNLNGNCPISAMRDFYFIQKDKEIIIEQLEKKVFAFTLPQELDYQLFEDNSLPYYKLPVV